MTVSRDAWQLSSAVRSRRLRQSRRLAASRAVELAVCADNEDVDQVRILREWWLQTALCTSHM